MGWGFLVVAAAMFVAALEKSLRFSLNPGWRANTCFLDKTQWHNFIVSKSGWPKRRWTYSTKPARFLGFVPVIVTPSSFGAASCTASFHYVTPECWGFPKPPSLNSCGSMTRQKAVSWLPPTP